MSLRLSTRPYAKVRIGWEGIALLILLVVQVTMALTLPVAAPVSVDEVVYAEMTRGLSDGFGFFIENGYEEVASPELVASNMEIAPNGRITGQYPVGLPLFAAPAYSILGIRAAMLLNAVALVAVVAMTYGIAKRLLDDKWTAGASVVVLFVSTYLWEYSLAIWPHMLALAFGLGAVLSMLIGVEEPPRRTTLFGLLSGLLFGLAILSRLDAVLLLPAVAACFFERRTTWMRATGFFAAGALPPMAILSYSNYVRWGSLVPFSYGDSGITTWLLPLAAIGLGTAVLVALVVYVFRRMKLHGRRRVIATAAVAIAAIAIIPVTRDFALQFLGGLWILVVDLRQLPITSEPTLERLPDGTLLYFGTVKKSLLQSLPYLFLALIPLVLAWRGDNRRAAAILMTPVIVYVAFYSMRPWHGGLSFNLRYFLPILPFVAILIAWALRLVMRHIESHVSTARLIRIVVIVTLALFVTGRLVYPTPEGSGFLFSIPPLVLAGVTAVVALLFLARPSDDSARVVLVIAVVGLTWASATAFGYDATTTLDARHSHAATSSGIAELIDDRSLLLAGWPDPFVGVEEHRADVVVALPGEDEFASLETVIAAFGRDRTVYGAMSEERWDVLLDVYPGDWVEVGQVRNYTVQRLEGTPTDVDPPLLSPAG